MIRKLFLITLFFTSIALHAVKSMAVEVKELTNADFYSAGDMSADDINSFYKDELPADKFDIWANKKDRIYLHGSWKLMKLANTRETPECTYGEDKGFQLNDYDDATWLNQPVPYYWQYRFNTDFKKYNMCKKFWSGIGWYRRTFKLPESLDHKRIILHCRMIDNKCSIYVNGKKAGSHENLQFDNFFAGLSYVRNNSFELDITELVRFGSPNSLAIKVYDDGKHVYSPKNSHFPGWGGIWQEIYLEIRPDIYLQQALIASDLANSSINVKAFVHNTLDSSRRVKLNALIGPWKSDRYTFAKGEERSYSVGTFELKPGENVIDFNVRMDSPIKWSTENPYLYHFKLIDEKGVVLGQERFGYRDFTVGKNLFKLNGKKIFLMGRQAECFRFFSSFTLNFLKRKDEVWNYLKTIKDVNYNLCRYHSTFMPNCFYTISDELGLLIYDELPRPGESGGGAGKVHWLPKLYNFKTNELTPLMKENIKQRVHLLYNYPSVVLFSAGNEIWDNQLADHKYRKKFGFESFTPYLDKVVEEYWKYDKTRPVSPCSGRAPTDKALSKVKTATWAQAVGKAPKGDFYDMHMYSWYPPLEIDDDENDADKGLTTRGFKKIYEAFAIDSGKERAVLNGEVGGTAIPEAGHVWKDKTIDVFKGHVKNGVFDKKWFVDYLGMVHKKLRWKLDDYSSRKECFFIELTTDEGMRIANARHIKRLYEMYRRKRQWMAGFANCYTRLFYYNNNRKTGKLKLNQPADEYIKASLQPLLACFDGKFNRNVIAGKSYSERVYVMNDRPADVENITVRVSLRRDGITAHEFTEFSIKKLASAEMTIHPLTIKLPLSFKSGHYTPILKVFVNGKEQSSNWANYDMYVLNPADIDMKTKTPVVVYVPTESENSKGVQDTKNVLKKLNISFRCIAELDEMTGSATLILPPYSWHKGASGKTFAAWLSAGGKVLCFQQDKMPFGLEGRIGTCRRAGFQTELLNPEYPLFKGLKHYDFFMWNGSRDNIMNKWFISAAVFPLTYAAQAVIQPDNFKLGASITESRIGEGLCLLSQLEALERFGEDSVATKYILNLLDYTLNNWDGHNAAKVTLGASNVKDLEFDKKKAFFVDLRSSANMGFKDDIARDKKGGWTDQGDKDMRNLPTGKLELRGVDFDIINPEQNNGKGCVVLRGNELTRTEFLPLEVEQIKVGKKVRKLYFLIASTWTPRTLNKKIAEIDMVYGKGHMAQVLFSKQSLTIVSGKNVADWEHVKGDLDGAIAGWIGPMGKSKQKEAMLYIIEWINPEPAREIRFINFKSMGVAVPVLVAITGEELK